MHECNCDITDDLSLAEGVFKEAISIFPNLSLFYFNLGVLLGKQGKYEVLCNYW